MGMGHRLKESQCEVFEFKGPKEQYEAGGGKNFNRGWEIISSVFSLSKS